MMEDATGGGVAAAAGLRGYDYRLRVKNLLEKKERKKWFYQLIGFFFSFVSYIESKSAVSWDGFIR